MIIFVLGIITAQILNVLMRSRRQDSREYLLYGLYLSVFVLYLLSLYLEDIIPSLNHPTVIFWANELKRPLGVLLYILYNVFIIAFLDLKTTKPSLYRIIYWFGIYLGASLVFQLIVQSVFRNNIKVQDTLYGAFSILVFGVSIYLIYQIWRFRTRLSAFILTGTLCLTVGIFLTNMINYLMMLERLDDGEYYFYPLLVGLGLEIYFFNRGLHYKTTLTEKELILTQKQLITEMTAKEKLLVDKQEMRNKIARDLHDNVGSTLSSIAVYSRVAKIYKDQDKPAAFSEAMNRIEEASASMIGEMNDIVWAINPRNDNMENLLQRMEAFARPLLQASGIQWHFHYTEAVKQLSTDMILKKNLYLTFKEALINAQKYSGCKNIYADIQLEESGLHMKISDDGKGFVSSLPVKPGSAMGGNGISNMYRRAAELNGRFEISSRPGQGTTVQLWAPSP